MPAKLQQFFDIPTSKTKKNGKQNPGRRNTKLFSRRENQFSNHENSFRPRRANLCNPPAEPLQHEKSFIFFALNANKPIFAKRSQPNTNHPIAYGVRIYQQ
jgi:hypothetical protein